MGGKYYEHPGYGHENRDHKTVTVTLKSPLTKKQLEALRDDAPQLDMKFGELSYCDGDLMKGGGFGHDWEKTDGARRGLLGYSVSGNEIKIWASEAVTPQYFAQAARYVLDEIAKTPLAYAEVSAVNTSGVAMSHAGNSLLAVAGSLGIAEAARKTAPRKPRAPGGPS